LDFQLNTKCSSQLFRSYHRR